MKRFIRIAVLVWVIISFSLSSFGLLAKSVEVISRISLDTTEDSDGDFLSDGVELARIGSSIDMVDSDRDGTNDFLEALRGSNLLSKLPQINNRLELVTRIPIDTTLDQDSDLLSDGVEQQLLGTFHDKADSDNDGVDDWRESLLLTNALFSESPPESEKLDLFAVLRLDTTQDSDGDFLSDGIEQIVLGLDPQSSDTDSDGRSDFEQVLRGLKAIRSVFETSLEIVATMNLDTTADSDADLLSDGLEAHLMTNAHLRDSDMDGIDDFYEILRQTNALFEQIRNISNSIILLAELMLDTTPDEDGDGLSNGVEIYVTFTHFQLVDTDSDGINDDVEILFGENPLDEPIFDQPSISILGNLAGNLILLVELGGATSADLEVSQDLINWALLTSIAFDGQAQSSQQLAIPIESPHAFYRLVITR